MTRVYVIHGFSASVSAHWFPSLKAEFDAEGANVIILEMPNPAAPNVDEWVDTLRRNIPSPDGKTVFVAHSLGCITLLRYLETLPEATRILGLFLVSGFVEPIPTLPELDLFTRTRLDYQRIIRMVPHRTVIGSHDDEVVPFTLTERLGALLKARLIELERAGHFLASDGFTEFPLLSKELRNLLQASTE